MRLYLEGKAWVLEVHSKHGLLKMTPTQYEIALWKELHPEDDPDSSAYHDRHCTRCAVCRECMDCNLRPCPDNDGVHTATDKGFVHHHKETA